MTDQPRDEAARQYLARQYLERAERQALVIPGVGPDVRPRPIDRAAIIGSGTMGGGIAMAFANAGIPVMLLDIDEQALARGLASVRRNYQTSVSRGRLSSADMEQRLSLITPTISHDDLAPADIAIEAVFEDLTLKQRIFARLDRVMKPGATLASNTSTLDIDAMAAVTSRPHDVIGTHFFSPANVMRMQENVRGAQSSPETIATVTALARRLGKVPVLAGNCDGFIGNRILASYSREADLLLLEGATPWQVDDVLKDFGFPMGVFLMRDLAGLDVGWRIRRQRGDTAAHIADRICEQGRFGQKTGSGYYDYDGRAPSPSPETLAIVEAVSAGQGIARTTFSNDEILTRILAALVNEGARTLADGIALRASDIDVIFAHGYGFPKDRGGPMYWAERQGLDRILSIIRGYHGRLGPRWAPAPLLEQRARHGCWTDGR